MTNSFYLAALALFTSMTIIPFSARAEGPSGSGGGAQIEAAFRLHAYGLIVRIANNVQANGICASTTLQDGLERTKIHIVDRLVDPSTGQPPVEKNLDAWTVPGNMQLLANSWQQFLAVGFTAAPGGRTLNTLILHETYRTTGRCNDNNFTLSERVMALLDGGAGTSRFSEMFAFTYPYLGGVPGDDMDPGADGLSVVLNDAVTPDRQPNMLCNQSAWNGHKLLTGKKITCLMDDGTIYYNMIIKPFDHDNPETWSAAHGTLRKTIPHFHTYAEMLNQWMDVSPAHPFVVMHDIENGTWTWGMQ